MMISTPILTSPVKEAASFSRAGMQRMKATPPPGRIPSSTAAFVAWTASSTRSFFSFISISVAAPTRMTANAAGEFRKALLEFFFVVVRSAVLRSAFLMRAIAVLDLRFFASAFNERRVFFFDDRFFHSAEHVDGDVFEFKAELFADEFSAGEDRDVFEDRFASVAKAWSFHSADFQASRGLC